jgi:hypothetical protein
MAMSFFMSLEDPIAAAAAEAVHHVPVSRALFPVAVAESPGPWIRGGAASAVAQSNKRNKLEFQTLVLRRSACCASF